MYVASADSHIIEPYDLWTKALGKKYGDRVPHRHEGEVQGVKGDFFFTGYEYMWIGELRQEGAGSTVDSTAPVPTENLPEDLVEKVRASNSDPAVRLELMAMDGVQAEIIQGTNMLLAMRVRDGQLVNDCAAVFNDYCADYCNHDTDRLIGTAMIPMRDIGWATRELERVAGKGLRTAIINADMSSEFLPYRAREYDAFWAAACDLDMPLTLHLGTGETRDPFTLITPAEKEEGPGLFLDIFDDGRRALAQEFVFGGIFDRFPKLRIILGEYECSWYPYYLFRLRQMQGALGLAMQFRRVKKSADEYIHDHVWLGFTDDPFVDRTYDLIADKLLWGSDYPHPRNTFPNTQKILDRIFKDVPADAKAKAVGQNMAKLFGLQTPHGKQGRVAAE